MFSLNAIARHNGSVTLVLAGSVNAAVLPEIDRFRSERQVVALDLSEVTLIDRVSARFLALQAERGIELVGCPSYLERWIHRELTHERK